MTNNALLERLMGNGPKEDLTSPTSSLPGNPANARPTVIVEDEATTIRVVSIKYKIYTFVLILLMISIGFNYYPKLKRNYDNTTQQITNFSQEISRLKAEQEELKNDQATMTKIIEEKGEFESCLNENDVNTCVKLFKEWTGEEDEEKMTTCLSKRKQEQEKDGHIDSELERESNEEKRECTNFLAVLEKGISVPVSYSQLHSLYSKNMIIDEKRILRNLNEYLIQNKFEMGLESRNGSIRSIHIGDPITEDEKGVFFSVPISFTIVFNNQDNLISFVHNVEKKLIEEEADRILYKIQTISYDIIDGGKEQTNTLELTAYYYYNPNEVLEENGDNDNSDDASEED